MMFAFTIKYFVLCFRTVTLKGGLLLSFVIIIGVASCKKEAKHMNSEELSQPCNGTRY